MRIGLAQAFLLSFAIGFIVGFVFIGASLSWLSFFIGAQAVFIGSLVVGLVIGILTGTVGAGMFYIWRGLGRGGQLAVIGIILVIGLLTVQPEIDGLALVGLMFTALGVKKGRR